MTENTDHGTGSKPKYVSKEGFERVPLIRGFDIIQPLWELLEDVKHITGKDCFICGGYARFCASPRREPVKAGDIDLYCEDESVFDVLERKLTAAGFEMRHENEVSKTYKHQDEGPFAHLPTIQSIKPLREARIVAFGTKEVILANFDFSIVRAAILSSKLVLVDADFLHDEKHTLLRLKNIHCPISSTLRCMKYAKKGYFLRPLECLRLFLDWDNRDDEYRSKLRDFIEKASDGEGLSQEEIDELEAMMRID